MKALKISRGGVQIEITHNDVEPALLESEVV